MVKNVLLGLVSLAMAVASAAGTYNVTFYEPVMIHGSELKPGDYKLELKDNTAVIKQGKAEVEAPVRIENDSRKHSQTIVRLNGMQLDQIELRGTNLRVVFDNTSNASR